MCVPPGQTTVLAEVCNDLLQGGKGVEGKGWLIVVYSSKGSRTTLEVNLEYCGSSFYQEECCDSAPR